MVVIRQEFQATFGQGGPLAKVMVAGISQMMPKMSTPRHWQLLTDLSGPFDTVVLEVEAENLAEWERSRHELFALPEFSENLGRSAHLMVSGRSELYTVEAEG